jgi:hypothetical protein
MVSRPAMPGHARIASPYDLDARWGVKREEFWLGCKLHITETCDDATTDATMTGNQMTGAIHDDLAEKNLAPGRHYLDSATSAPPWWCRRWPPGASRSSGRC